MYLGLPISAYDQLEYNAHRIYGAVRLPLMTADWEVLGAYEAGRNGSECGTGTCNGMWDHWAKKSPVGEPGFQPVLVLRNRRATPCRSY